MSDFQSMSRIITIAIIKGKRRSDTNHNHNRDMSSFAERLAAARKEAGMTQAELARAAGLKNQSIIGSLESGYRKSTSYSPALADALGVSARWLADGKGSRTLAEATGYPEAAPTYAAKEPPPPALDEMSVEARATILVELAGEVSALWMALPPDRRMELLLQLRTEAGHRPGKGRSLPTPQRKPGPAATLPDTKAHREAD